MEPDAMILDFEYWILSQLLHLFNRLFSSSSLSAIRVVLPLEKTLMLGGIGGQEEKGMTEDEMAG